MSDCTYIVAVDPDGDYFVLHAMLYKRLGPYATAADAERAKAALNAAATRSAH